MKILRAFQVINQDGEYSLSSTYNVIDEKGNLVSRNEKDSFFVVDKELKTCIDTIEDYIKKNRLV